MIDVAELQKWVGRSETTIEQITPFQSRALAATLDRDDPPYDPGSDLPPLWHWMHFLNISPLREAGADGHPRRGGFLPPVPLPRRMWAGSRLEFLKPLKIGETARKTSTIKKIDHKSGRTGELVFVTVRHEYEGPAGLAIADEHDIVYRGASGLAPERQGNTPSGPAPERPDRSTPAPGAEAPKAPPARTDAQWRRTIHPDAVLLFRYSALTFNSHRIHYDLPYVTQEEGYPGLIVHGPLIATLLLDLAGRELPQATVRSFAFRAVSPLFSGNDFQVCGRREGNAVALWAANGEGGLAMEGKAVIA